MLRVDPGHSKYVAQEATEDILEGLEHYHIAQAVDPVSITHDNGVFEH